MTNKRAIVKPLTMIVVHTMMLSVYNIRRFKKHSKHIYEPTSHFHIHDYIWQPASAILKAHESISTIFFAYLMCLDAWWTKILNVSTLFYKCSFSIIIHDTNTEIGPTETLSSLFPSVRVSLSSCCWMLFITLERIWRVKGTWARWSM